jgi:hypothetical protein
LTIKWALLCKLERDSMPNVHTITTRPSSSIQEERLSLLMTIQDQIEISMTENNPSSHKTMWLVSSHFLESLQIFLCDLLRSPFLDQGVIIESFQDSICADLSSYVPWIDILLRARCVGCDSCWSCRSRDDGGFRVCQCGLLFFLAG